MQTLTLENFTLAEKRSAGLSYPAYVNNLREIGVTHYEVDVTSHDRKIFTDSSGKSRSTHPFVNPKHKTNTLIASTPSLSDQSDQSRSISSDNAISVEAKDAQLNSDPNQHAYLLVPGHGLLLTVNPKYHEAGGKMALYSTQTGLADYPAFLAEIAEAGVHHYTADLRNRIVTYFGTNSGDFYKESIPLVSKIPQE